MAKQTKTKLVRSTKDKAQRKQTIARNIERFYDECINGGNLDVIDEIFAEDFAGLGREKAYTRAEVKQDIRRWRESFPDQVTVAHNLIIQGNRASWSDTFRGTQTGPYMGQAAPTNKPVTNVMAISTARFNERGQIVSHRMVVDEVYERQQLGLLPSDQAQAAQAQGSQSDQAEVPQGSDALASQEQQGRQEEQAQQQQFQN